MIDTNKNNLYFGFFIGATSPLLGFAIVYALFEFLVNKGFMDTASMNINDQRMRTIFLIAICTNIFWIRRFNRPFQTQSLRGVVFATMFFSILWFGKYFSAFYSA